MNEFITLFAAAVNPTADIVKETEEFFLKTDLRQLLNQFIQWCGSFVGNIIIAVLTWVIGKKLLKYLIKILRKMLDRSRLDEGVVKFILSVSNAAGYVILGIMIIDILGFETTSLIAILGSAGIAIGMSLQGSLSNFAGGILILLSKPFVLGDYIVVNGQEGTVKAIDILYTRLQTIDNKTVIMPNGTLANADIVNVGDQPVRRIDIQIGISYTSDIKKAKSLLAQIMEQQPQIIKDREILVVVKELAASCITLETRAWVETGKYWDVRFELLERYKEVFDSNDIEIPFNQLDVHIKN